MSTKAQIKELLGELPFTAELYWYLRNRDIKAFSRFNLDVLKAHLPQMVAEVKPFALSNPAGRSIFIFASTHFWINHTVAVGLALRGLGHQVTLGYLPYSDYTKPINKFDLRRNDLYAHEVLKLADPLLKSVSLLEIEPAGEIPEALHQAITQISTFDARYVLQREDITGNEPTFQLRQERNLEAASRVYTFFQKDHPEMVIIPNGMIQEYGAIYETVRSLGIPTITYEFGEQDERIWLGKNKWVIHHSIDDLWAERKERILNKEQRSWLEAFLGGRQKLTAGSGFAHLWQKADRAGGTSMLRALGLDERPIVLLPTNVLGDSATLGLEVFSNSMTEWMEQVLLYLAAQPKVQVVIRIHPGETLTVGPSVMEIVKRILPELPAHIHLIGPSEKVNTYDLMEITDLALVYTTTAGLEMAVRGIPVLVSGRAHYRGKGFTLEAQTWDEYYSVLESALKAMPATLSAEQIELAKNYAYTFFAEYPQPFPWHLETLWPSLEKRPLADVLSASGKARYAATFQQMAGVPSIKQFTLPTETVN